MRRGGCAAPLALLGAVALGAGGYALWERRADADLAIAPMVAGFQRQNELTVFAAQVVAVPTTREAAFGLVDRTQTSIVPARVRYTVDLARLTPRDVAWRADTATLTVRVPGIEVQPAQLDVAHQRIFRTGPPAAAATWDRFERSNNIKAAREARTLAGGAELMRLAEAAARDAIAGNAAMFLRGADLANARVVVRFAGEPRAIDGERMERSRSLHDVYRAR